MRRSTEKANQAEAGRSDLEALYRTHGQQVARWAARLAGPSLDAEDLTQEVFLIVQRRLPAFRGEAAITTWLYGITANVVRHRRRRERIYRWFHGYPESAALEVAAAGPSPLDEYERRSAAALVYRALDGISERHRAALILFELEGLAGAEIAALMGVRPATLRVWLHRARAEFVKRLGEIETKEGRAWSRPREASDEAG